MINIDLRKYQAPTTKFLRKAIADFSAKFPDVEVATLGLSGTGFHGDVAVHFDTAEHSEEFVEECSAIAMAEVGSDRKGEFCDGCEDFAHARFAEFSYPKYPNFYDVDEEEPVSVVTLAGKKVKVNRDDGDEAFNKVVFPFLRDILKAAAPYKGLHRAKVLRAGVEMNNSEYKKFWIVS